MTDWIRSVWFSDEAHFLLSGHVKSKNAVYLGLSKPGEVLQKPVHSVKCTVWVAMSSTVCATGLIYLLQPKGQHGFNKMELHVIALRTL